MNEVNRTLFIPLYGKALVSRHGRILRDPDAERIWDAEGFPIRGKSRSMWLAYNMAMRARVFDDWTGEMLSRYPEALVLHVGCGLDSRCRRVDAPRALWLDCDFPEVLALRSKYFPETEDYRLLALDASDPSALDALPESGTAVVVLEGLSMYLTNEQLRGFLEGLSARYPRLRVLMDVYTDFGARASKWKNPVKDVGVSEVYGVGDIQALLAGSPLRVKAEHSFTPERLIRELKPGEQRMFRLLFTGRMYGRLYRLFELEAGE